MEVLIIGFSSIVRRRVLPALNALEAVERVHVASRRHLPSDLIPQQKRGLQFENYEKGLSALEPCLAYISLPNSLHAEWTKRALDAGFHVVVDKPTCVSMAELELIVELSQSRGLCVAEATLWNYHPQCDLIHKALRDAGSRVTRITAIFSFPPFPSSNFRNLKELGGGSLLDLGPYAASCCRVFFGAEPEDMVCRVHTWNEITGIDTSFSLLVGYSEGRCFVGHFGFDTEYHNQLNLLGSGLSISVDRIFTTPTDLANEIHIRSANTPATMIAPEGDSFCVFLLSVLKAIEAGSWSSYTHAMLEDAKFLERMRASSGVNYYGH